MFSFCLTALFLIFQPFRESRIWFEKDLGKKEEIC